MMTLIYLQSWLTGFGTSRSVQHTHTTCFCYILHHLRNHLEFDACDERIFEYVQQVPPPFCDSVHVSDGHMLNSCHIWISSRQQPVTTTALLRSVQHTLTTCFCYILQHLRSHIEFGAWDERIFEYVPQVSRPSATVCTYQTGICKTLDTYGTLLVNNQ